MFQSSTQVMITYVCMPGEEHRVGINEGTWGSNKGGARKSVNFCSDTYKIACF